MHVNYCFRYSSQDYRKVGFQEVINCLNECIGDLAPVESWGDSSQNCLHNMDIVSNA